MTAHQADSDYPDRSREIELAPDCSLIPYASASHTLAGFFFLHEIANVDDTSVDPDDGLRGRCCGGVPVVGPNAWTMTGSIEGGDLTLSPSLLCLEHGFHGFVQNGKWVPA